MQANAAPVTSSLAGRRQLYPILRRFPGILNDRLALAEQGWRNGNARRVADFAHWLAGSGGTLGYDEFTEPARALDLLASSGRLAAPDVARRFAQIRSLTSRIVVPAEDDTGVEQVLRAAAGA